jgi:hypothetical protein
MGKSSIPPVRWGGVCTMLHLNFGERPFHALG